MTDRAVIDGDLAHRRSQERQLWGAFLASGTPEPTDQEQATRWALAMVRLRADGVMPEEIPPLVAAYCRHFSQRDCSPMAIAAYLPLVRERARCDRRGETEEAER